MNDKKSVLIGGVLVALLIVAVIGVTNAYAQTPAGGPWQGPGPDGGRGPMGGAGLEAAAQILGLTADELTTALKEGKTLAQLAQEAGVEFADVQAAMQAARGDDLPGRGRMGGPASEAAAQALGLTTDELTTALKEGKTLAQLAEAAGVELEDVQAAMQSEREAQMRDRIQQSLTDGTITQEHADWLLEGLDKGFLNGPGGFGFDGPHGPGAGPATDVQPTQEAGQ